MGEPHGCYPGAGENRVFVHVQSEVISTWTMSCSQIGNHLLKLKKVQVTHYTQAVRAGAWATLPDAGAVKTRMRSPAFPALMGVSAGVCSITASSFIFLHCTGCISLATVPSVVGVGPEVVVWDQMETKGTTPASGSGGTPKQHDPPVSSVSTGGGCGHGP